MRTLWVAVCLVIGCCGCGEQGDGTRPAAILDREDIQVAIQWPEGRKAVEIPFEFLNEMPVITCQLNGKSAVLYLDTAAGGVPFFLYEDRLAEFGLTVTSEKDHPSYTAGGRLKTTRYCGAFTLTLQDGLSIKVSGASCLPADGKAPANRAVAGILGVLTMNTLNAVIDFEANTITFNVKPASNKSGAANGSQPNRSETNRASSAAGSRR